MRRFTSIVATNYEGVIGAGNNLPWRLKSDLNFFKETTSKNVVIMGRKTFDSLGQKCLPNRRNVILTHSLNLLPHKSVDCQSVNGLEEAMYVANTAPQRCREIFVIGGSSIYKQFTPFVERYLITVVGKKVQDGDAFFDESYVREHGEWEMQQIGGGEQNNEGDEAPFSIFELTSKNPEYFVEQRRKAIQNFEQRLNNMPSKNSKKSYRTSGKSDHARLAFS